MNEENSNKISEKIIIDYCNKLDSNFNYDERKEKLIELLENIQKTAGHISRESTYLIADKLRLPLTHIYGVITFYNSLKLEQSSKYVINVCRGTACHVNGSEKLIPILEREIKNSNNPSLFSIDIVNCVGACSLAPVLMVNEKIHGHMNEEKIKELITKLENKCNSCVNKEC